MIARSTLWGTIQTGEAFHLLSERQQNAVLAHERGHIHHRHAWKRLGWIVTFRAFFNWPGFLAMCERQELEADRYACERGHYVGLYVFLHQLSKDKKYDGYPTVKERLEALHD